MDKNSMPQPISNSVPVQNNNNNILLNTYNGTPNYLIDDLSSNITPTKPVGM